MAINVNDDISPKPFPKLMRSKDGDIFYMVKEGYGLPLTDVEGGGWDFSPPNFADFSFFAKDFVDYNEPITIQNA